MIISDEIRKASDHLNEAAKLVSAATAKLIEGRGIGRTLVSPLAKSLESIEQADHQLSVACDGHATADRNEASRWPKAATSK